MKIEKTGKKAQQEMIGFVLIVVLVVIASMVFLVISVRKSRIESQSTENIEIKNLLSSIMSYTTECAIVFEPDYDKIEDLIKSCYDNKRCDNLDKMACEYLNEILSEIIADVLKTESQADAYRLDIIHEYSDGSYSDILKLSGGDCTNKTSGTSESINTDSGNIIINLIFCYD